MWEQWQKGPRWWQSMHVWEPVRLSWDHFSLQWFAEKGWVPWDSIHSPHLGADLWAQMLAFDGTGSTQLPRPLVALLCCPRQWSVPCVCLSFLKHLTHFLPSPFFPGFYDCTLSWDPLLVQGWLIFSLFSAPSFSPPPSLKAGRPQGPLGGPSFLHMHSFPQGQSHDNDSQFHISVVSVHPWTWYSNTPCISEMSTWVFNWHSKSSIVRLDLLIPSPSSPPSSHSWQICLFLASPPNRLLSSELDVKADSPCSLNPHNQSISNPDSSSQTHSSLPMSLLLLQFHYQPGHIYPLPGLLQ